MREPDEFQVLAQAHDAARRFRRTIGERTQSPPKAYAELKAEASFDTPETGAPADETIARLIDVAEPGLHAMTGPRFFAWVIGNSHPVGVAADWLASAWGQNSANHLAAPSAVVVEEIAAYRKARAENR